MAHTASEDVLRAFARYGVASVYEGAGQTGLIDVPLHQIVPGSRVAGPARTVHCAQNDNLMVHAVMDQAQPGEVLVITMPEPAPVALVGDLLATQAHARGVAAILVDAAVRDIAELREMGLPIWARYIRVVAATKSTAGAINTPVTMGGTVIAPGDIIVLDADGAVAVSASRAASVLQATAERVAREDTLREKLRAGDLTYDLHGLRAKFEGHGV